MASPPNRRQGRSPLRVPPGSSLGSVLGRMIAESNNASVEADETSTRVVDVAEDIDAAAREHMVRRPPGWWQMRNNFWIHMTRMSDGHLDNVIRMVASRQRDTQLIQELTWELSRRQTELRQRNEMRETLEADRRSRIRSGGFNVGIQGIYAGLARSGAAFRAGIPDGGDLGRGSGPAIEIPDNVRNAVRDMLDDITSPLTEEERLSIMAFTSQAARDMVGRPVRVPMQTQTPAPRDQWIQEPEGYSTPEAPDPPLPARARRIKE